MQTLMDKDQINCRQNMQSMELLFFFFCPAHRRPPGGRVRRRRSDGTARRDGGVGRRQAARDTDELALQSRRRRRRRRPAHLRRPLDPRREPLFSLFYIFLIFFSLAPQICAISQKMIISKTKLHP